MRLPDRFETIRILIDQGSELSFVAEELVSRLHLSRRLASIPLVGIGGAPAGSTKGRLSLQLQSMHDSTLSCEIEAYILPKLTCQLPSFNATTNSWPHIQGLPLADPDYGRPGPIHLLIGSDNYGQIIKPELIHGEAKSPLAQLTIFGWTLSGPTDSSASSSAALGYHCAKDHDLEELLTRFWTQEEMSITESSSLTPEEATCESYFQTSHSRDIAGRYIVRLPLKYLLRRLEILPFLRSVVYHDFKKN